MHDTLMHPSVMIQPHDIIPYSLAVLSDDGEDSTLCTCTLMHPSVTIHANDLMLYSSIVRLVRLLR